MPRMEGILNLPVQDPLCPEFSAAHINWVKLEGGRQCGDNIALIPFARVDDFVKGESSNPPMPCEFSRRIKKEETYNPAPCEDMQKQGGPQNRDDFLTRNDVRNMERTVRNSSNELHENDECSVKIWVQQHQKHVFYFQDNSSSEPFVLGIQTDWQLQQMLRFGNNSFISFHSSFGLKKLKYPICSLLVFNSSQNAIPVAWIITSSFVVEELMQIFVDQCAFMDYFKSHWLASIDMWINAIKSLSVTTPEPHAAIESYHLKLKSMLLKENYASFWPRVDWLGNLCKHVIKVATFCRSQQVARPSLSTQGYKQALLTLLHNPPDDPLVLDLTILHVTHLQQDIKALEDFSNNGLLQPIAPDLSSQT
ncbi:hypothetical protein D0Y65_014013 [Glycine soja]|uniref:Uncharacterized protein n=1 Tax=Glycine soja TaxID=3848 RepID=A0A445K5X8_GLYSO|nr:hypothetical protein D0Y65_014013 [Glycine soja]